MSMASKLTGYWKQFVQAQLPDKPTSYTHTVTVVDTVKGTHSSTIKSLKTLSDILLTTTKNSKDTS